MRRIPSTQKPTQCANCGANFGFFDSKNLCDRCGQTYCKDCMFKVTRSLFNPTSKQYCTGCYLISGGAPPAVTINHLIQTGAVCHEFVYKQLEGNIWLNRKLDGGVCSGLVRLWLLNILLTQAGRSNERDFQSFLDGKDVNRTQIHDLFKCMNVKELAEFSQETYYTYSPQQNAEGGLRSYNTLGRIDEKILLSSLSTDFQHSVRFQVNPIPEPPTGDGYRKPIYRNRKPDHRDATQAHMLLSEFSVYLLQMRWKFLTLFQCAETACFLTKTGELPKYVYYFLKQVTLCPIQAPCLVYFTMFKQHDPLGDAGHALGIYLDQSQRSSKIIFFDPNYGIFSCRSLEEFQEFFATLLNNHYQAYGDTCMFIVNFLFKQR